MNRPTFRAEVPVQKYKAVSLWGSVSVAVGIAVASVWSGAGDLRHAVAVSQGTAASG
jgi:hypothetical protein